MAPIVLEPVARQDAGASDRILSPPGRAHVELMLAYTLMGRSNPAHSAPFDGTHISSAVLLLLPSSQGRISLASCDPADDPVIDAAYQSTAADRAMPRLGVGEVLRIAELLIDAGVLEAEKPPEGNKVLGSEGGSDEDIDKRIKGFASTMYHPAGSVALGAA